MITCGHSNDGNYIVFKVCDDTETVTITTEISGQRANLLADQLILMSKQIQQNQQKTK